MPVAPQPIAYQGSKRRLAASILRHLPRDTATFFEPFVGSGAMTLAAALHNRAQQFVIGDTLHPLAGIWHHLVQSPDQLSEGYAALWHAQLPDPRGHYLAVRAAFNLRPQPDQLLYLLARCVKNAVRFNALGQFNQSADHRRLGTQPAQMAQNIRRAHRLLAGRTQVHAGDYGHLLHSALPTDVVYLDPPYAGVSQGRDPRYAQTLDFERFVSNLAAANQRGTAFLVSFDGRCGDKTFGPPLPDGLGLRRLEIAVGRSSQATLHGRDEQTVEALYLSQALVRRLATFGQATMS